MYSSRYSCKILIKMECSRRVLEKSSNIKVMKIRTVEAEFFRTDITKQIVTFRNFANAPKFSTCIYVFCMCLTKNSDYFPILSDWSQLKIQVVRKVTPCRADFKSVHRLRAEFAFNRCTE
jgi:hypothetical protein